MNGSPQLDRSFLALAHPVRRGILERLARGPATVGEAAKGLGASKPAVSKHLKVLEEAGVITRTVEGRTHRLTVDRRPLADAGLWIEQHTAMWEAKFDAVEQYLSEQEKGGGSVQH